jgi:hypothetical protein
MMDIPEDFVPTPDMYEGLACPVYCPRNLTDCTSMAQIIAQGHASFICVGENDGSKRVLSQDKYRMCFKNSLMDEMSDFDKRDLVHFSSVMIQGLAIIEGRDSAAYHDPDLYHNKPNGE